jgi:hypothetical protein
MLKVKLTFSSGVKFSLVRATESFRKTLPGGTTEGETSTHLLLNRSKLF